MRPPRSLPGLLVLGMLASACTFGGSRRAESEAPPVPTARAERGEFRVIVEEVGVLRAQRGERLRADGWGMVSTLLPDGAEVKPGDVVVQLDVAEFESELAQVEAGLQESRSEAGKHFERMAFQEKSQALDLKVSQANAAFAERKLLAAQAALKDADRQLARGLISQSARDQEEESLRSAGLEAERALVAHERKLEDVASERRGIDLERQRAESQFAQLENQKKQVVEQIERATIRSPGVGRVFYAKRRWRGGSEERKLREGDEVGPWVGSFAEIPDLSSIEARSQVDETLLGRVKEGTAVEITAGAVAGLALKGRVSKIEMLAVPRSRSEGGGFRGDTPSPDAVEQVVFPVTIALSGTDDRLQPGMTVSVTYVLATVPGAVSVPEPAVFGTAGEAFVFVKARRGPERRVVTLGPSSAGRVVIDSGLDDGEEIYLGDPRGAGGGSA